MLFLLMMEYNPRVDLIHINFQLSLFDVFVGVDIFVEMHHYDSSLNLKGYFH